MSRYFFAFLLFLVSCNLFGQPISFHTSDTLHLQFLQKHPNYKLTDINNYIANIYFYPKKEASLTYLSTNNGIYALPNGTGAVYKLTNASSFERIDSTLFQGYNNHAVNFMYHDTIYSFGGYGLWHNNGQLRYFNFKKAEWELIPLDKLVPITSGDFTDIRDKLGYIFVHQKNKINEGTKEKYETPVDTIYKIVIRTGEVSCLGSATEKLKGLTKMPISFYTNYGTIMLNSHEAILLDFEHNEIRNWEEIKIGNLFLSGLAKIKTTIHNDSAIYYFSDNVIDSLIIPIHKMKYLGAIYQPSNLSWMDYTIDIAFISIVGLLITMSFIIYTKYITKQKVRKKEAISSESNIVAPPLKDLKKDSFSNIELEILQLLQDNLEIEEKVNVETLNAILGVTKKSTEVQRKQRSQTIAAINIKAKEILNIDDDVVIRIKNEIDSRIISYSINEKHAIAINKLIN